ncbi:lytic polysaccharide monooxygenase [Canariomyces notabilis]|uniref:lytic cellulose monooxygenase (C4-dehydrogenating) n=1 Tax=Canariomyces notabilis TaxID=2074819 RepID=A0AAN6YR56_9PEZI|nr:lytic polysaccharide monooxygenase [Canariomyces arenarius]
MRPYLAALLSAVLIPGALGHQVHGILLVNGTASREWQYVRDVKSAWVLAPGEFEGSEYHKSTADVLAGSEVGFKVSWAAQGNPGFWHPGPVQIYMSRAPKDDLASYRGDGDWFKIAYGGPANNTNWLTTPPGKYLLRIEQFMPLPDMYNWTAQWYINCAHVNIIGPGGGTPTGFARFPGTYEQKDPGITITTDLFADGGVTDGLGLLEYKPPGPAVWEG